MYLFFSWEDVVENEGEGGLGFYNKGTKGEVDAAKVVKGGEVVAWCMLLEECDVILVCILLV